RLPSQSSAARPVARALFPSAPWQLFLTSARRVRHHPETRRRWRRWLVQVECRTRRLLRALVAPSPARRAGIWRLRFLCPVLPPVEQIMLSWSCRDLLFQLWRSYLCFSFSRTELVLISYRFIPRY